MKLDSLVAHEASFNVERSAERGENLDATIYHDGLPNVQVKYENNSRTTSLKIKMLNDDGLPVSTEGRTMEIRLYSTESIDAFFDVFDLIRNVVTGARWTPPEQAIQPVPF